MENNSHKFCETQCPMYPHCICFREASKAVDKAISTIPADTLANWEITKDDQNGIITITARDTIQHPK
jgi:hypothetical protein